MSDNWSAKVMKSDVMEPIELQSSAASIDNSVQIVSQKYKEYKRWVNFSFRVSSQVSKKASDTRNRSRISLIVRINCDISSYFSSDLKLNIGQNTMENISKSSFFFKNTLKRRAFQSVTRIAFIAFEAKKWQIKEGRYRETTKLLIFDFERIYYQGLHVNSDIIQCLLQ
uniref:Uncharacterized protein n=1 Tax=Spironucleus salmonicida TaxID=348837 RepID=V6LXE9_9EUKA|eukprot:EST48396.1 Hypothetical protein SS50377_11434 [Spironucleus salmonicida]